MSRFAILLVTALCAGCATVPWGQRHVADDGHWEARFKESKEKDAANPAESLEAIFGRKPFVLAHLKGADAPWLFAYRVDVGDQPWFTGKGPVNGEFRKNSHLNFNYIVEGYNRKLGIPFEDLKLGQGYMSRYFVVRTSKDGAHTLYVVGFYSEMPINWRWYKRFDSIVASVRTHG